MKTRIAFELIHHGDPIPASRPRMGKGHGFHAPAYAAYLDDLRWVVKAQLVEERRNGGTFPLLGPLEVSMRFYRSDWRRMDLDNLAKAGLDAMTAFVFLDDSQVDVMHLRKIHGSEEPRIEIAVSVSP